MVGYEVAVLRKLEVKFDEITATQIAVVIAADAVFREMPRKSMKLK